MVLQAALLAGALSAVYSFLVEPRWVDWHQEEVEIHNLPPVLEGFQICHLSDLHAFDGASPAMLTSIIKECNRRQPDLVALTGDLINNSPAAIDLCARILGGLKARCGVFAVLGSHDYSAEAEDQLVAALREDGIRVLRNEVAVQKCDASPLLVVGLDDNSSGRADLEATLKDVPPGALTLLLMHSPDSIHAAAKRNITLALAGHTHGGQVCLPLYGPIKTMSYYGRRYSRGKHQVGSTFLYVSRGIGSHHHVRFLARPEVPWLTLVSAPPAGVS